MVQERFTYLLAKYRGDTLSEEEREEFFDAVASGKYDDLLDIDFDKRMAAAEGEDVKPMPARTEEKILKTILGAGRGDRGSGFFTLRNRIWQFSVAASVLGVLFTGYLFYLRPASQAPAALSEFLKTTSGKVSNNTGSPLVVTLPDNSRITLTPSASVYYAKEGFTTDRKVYVEGDAAFNITKDPAHPFYVHSGDFTTKVLGTSFTIAKNIVSGNMEVSVITGRVEVYKNESTEGAGKTANRIVVTPNQKAVYKAAEQAFEATLVERPVPIAIVHKDSLTLKPAMSFKFENTPVQTVIKNLAANYGIPISCANEAVYRCEFTGDITGENLYDQLKIMCLAINAAYEISGTQIIITGEGCKPAAAD